MTTPEGQSNSPTLSVVMANYNHGHYIGAALQAILTQSFKPREVIVVDDGSTDNSVEVIESIAADYPILRLLRNGRNRGYIYTTNRGIFQAKGDYVLLAAADDWVLPGLFEKSMKLLVQYPEAGFCCSRVLISDINGKIVSEAPLSADLEGFVPPARIAAELKRNRGIVQGSGLILRRSAVLEFNGNIEGLSVAADSIMDFAIALKHGACYIQEHLSVTRHTGANWSQSLQSIDAVDAESEAVSNVVGVLTSEQYRRLFPREYISYQQRRALYCRQRAIYYGYKTRLNKLLSDMKSSIARANMLDYTVFAVLRLMMCFVCITLRAYVFLRFLNPYILKGRWFKIEHRLRTWRSGRRLGLELAETETTVRM